MRGLAEKTYELIAFAKRLLREFHPMTLRQLHYAIFSAAKIEYDNTPADYKRLGRATSKARRDYRAYERLAIHPEDIRLFHLPPQKIKATDSRAEQFKRQFGAKAHTVELDALPVDELRRRVREAVAGLIEWDSWNRQCEVQQVELKCIADFADRMKNLPEAPGAE